MTNNRLFMGMIPLVGYILLMPIYMFAPGSPQIADFLMLAIAAGMVFSVSGEFPARVKVIIGVLLIFCAYSVVINGIFSMTAGDITLLKSSLFYIFNLIAFVCLVRYYQVYGYEFLRVVALTVAVSLCLQLFIMLTGLHPGARGVRTTIWFNNPNQLGYWSLLSISIVAYAVKWIKIPALLLVSALVAGTFLVVLCLSKAATVGMVLLFCLIALRRPAVMIVAALLIVGVISTPQGSEWVGALQHRLETVGQQADDSAEGRGYDRIVDNSRYWVFGSGEGAYQRWSSAGRDKEIHSSFGSMFFCYGIVGFIIFSAAIALILGATANSWLYCLPLMLYGITHNGLRFTSFWLFLAFIFCVNDWLRTRKETAPAQAADSPPAELIPDALPA